MLTRLYIDNYKCFVNFECAPNRLQLVLGDNGTGKTAIFDVLETIRDFVSLGTTTVDAFPSQTLTAWEMRPEQTFEIELQRDETKYVYRLVVEHDRHASRNRIKSERLTAAKTLLYEFDGSDAHLYRDDGSAGPVFPFDWSRSAIPTIPDRNENQQLTWFRRRMERFYIFSPDPRRMTTRSDRELERPDRNLHELASWLRHLRQESLDTATEIRSGLIESIDNGLVDYILEQAGENARLLKFRFQLAAADGVARPPDYFLRFDQLSEGQRTLTALFAILHAAVSADATVCIDEPDNYVSLREIQPWLMHLRDRVDEENAQCLLISHHPEVINYLAADHGLWFFREQTGPVRFKKFESNGDEMLPPAEMIARGWAEP
jgi:predicted ATPase